ncbi:hypothetical protein [Pelagibaculum spongiae]|uniref:Uncharacterized protein n=1 Tax=Pelagibaculum spongiae TaxID=2080658 RepID=A0A2V1GXX5_9GAMM|nr:hypothetical protein [Pelagibaculum spongiae]PVZ66372.1 hypothetical protein DC094_16880 [Pelagibaculum spongiae]
MPVLHREKIRGMLGKISCKCSFYPFNMNKILDLSQPNGEFDTNTFISSGLCHAIALFIAQNKREDLKSFFFLSTDSLNNNITKDKAINITQSKIWASASKLQAPAKNDIFKNEFKCDYNLLWQGTYQSKR